MRYKVVSFNIGTAVAGTNVDITSPGFEVKAVVLTWSGRTESVNTNGAATYQSGIGFANSSTSRRYISRTSEHASASSNITDGDGSDACIAAISTGGAYVGKADFVSGLSNGFRLVIDQQFTPNLLIIAHCFGGDDVTDIETGIFTEPAAAGNLNVTTGFEFDHLFLIGQASGTAQPSLNATGRVCFGFCDAAFNQAVWMGGSLDGQASSNTGGYCRLGEILAQRTNAAGLAINSRGSVTAKTSTNFTVNFSEVVGTNVRQYMYLIMKGGKSAVGSLLTLDDTVTPIVITNLGFTPEGAMLMSGSIVEDAADTPHAKDEFCIGGFDATDDLVHAFRDDNAEANMEVSTAVNFDNCFINLIDAGGIDSTMQKQSIDADGFTMIMSNAEPAGSTNFVPYFVFGNVSSGSKLSGGHLAGSHLGGSKL